MNNKKKNAILIVSSGTSNVEARKNSIEPLENRISEKFNNYQVKRAFTSFKIIKRIKDNEGIDIDSPREALERLLAEGFKEVFIQPLHIIPGSEYEKLLAEAEDYNSRFEKLEVGRPLLYENKDYSLVAEILKNHFQKFNDHKAVVMVGHGSDHQAQESYLTLQKHLDKAFFKGYVGTIKGKPGIMDVIESLKKNQIQEVILMPFMLVAGNHALEDIISERDNSWKSILIKNGINVTIYLKGIGEIREFQDIYIDKIK
ncbi:sirohydrochlorin cobaltochelatase [Clostridium cellulovorans]|uniref:Sirohydrochlorin cobaltochelatase n=1 Tax=Clostridium cellulovorans (strain ATCC 35296 / DSM 3052 / OCM 3 / 743B) TaxID=573061 RepID=D9SWD1_CLOC7|nr:sirohydrochlorin cobaltochelatase [Clostridium cellulovorans]ADL51275.1 Sirohydrochlorin cobaltochelatase [Clostridium cellulovorans 743B]